MAGVARLGTAGLGTARRGQAWRGTARHGAARHGVAGKEIVVDRQLRRTLMKTITVVLVLGLTAALSASTIDRRIATMKKVYVEPVDDLGFDRPVAQCLKKHLTDQTSLEVAADKADAEFVFRVSGNLPSATTRYLVGAMGGTPSGHLFVETAAGEKIWDDGAKLRRAIGKNGKLDSADGDNTVECGLATELLGTLRNAMRKARDAK
jgi:hypothetical protein